MIDQLIRGLMDSMPINQIKGNNRDWAIIENLTFNWQHAASLLVNHWPQDWRDLIASI